MGCEIDLKEAVLCLIEQISQGPSPYDVTVALVIPALAAAAAVFIGVASWRTAAKATQIAELALHREDARAVQEAQRVETAWTLDYAARLDGHFSALFEEIGQYSAAHDAWLDACDEIEMHWGGPPEDIPYPPAPTRGLLDARLQSVMLHARNDDRLVLGSIDGYVRAVMRSRSTWKLSHRLTFLVELIRKWRDGSIASPVFMGRLKRKRRTVELDRDTPPRRG